MKRFAALLLAACLGTAAAGRDSGTISNWNEYAGELGRVQATGAFGSLGTPQEYNMLRASFAGGRFNVVFDDRAANTLATPSPSAQECPQVSRSAGLRTTLVTGVAVQLPSGLVRLTREGTSGKYAVSDVWVYASNAGRVSGQCATTTNRVLYRLALAQGWNAVRVYVDGATGTSIIQNISGPALAWKLR